MRGKQALIGWLAIAAFAAPVLADPPPAVDVTICEIQQYVPPVAADVRVHTTGTCWVWTGRLGYQHTIIADTSCGGTWNSIDVYVFDEDLVAHEGDCVEVWGTVTEYYDKTEIYVHSPDHETFPEPNRPIVTPGGCAGSMPVPLLVPTGQVAQEQYEMMWIEVHDVTVMSNPDGFGNWEVDDGSGRCVVLLGADWTPPPPIGSVIGCINGFLDYHFEEFKIRPRAEEEFPCGGAQPTATPTPVGATPTPSGSETPTPTPTQGVSCDPSIHLILDKIEPTCYLPGDTYRLQYEVDNSSCPQQNVDLYLALEVYGAYYLYPNWDMSVVPTPLTLPAFNSVLQTVLQFAWPAGAGAASGINWYGVIVYPGTFELIPGGLDQISFCFAE